MIGLLRREISDSEAAHEAIERAIGHVNAVAIVHGLHGRDVKDSVSIEDMIRIIISSVRDMAVVPVQYEEPLVSFTSILTREEAVPLALIANELITNALKHCADSENGVSVSLRKRYEQVHIVIRNTTKKLPVNFNFSKGTGLGDGLNLVRSLLPEKGAAIEFEYAAGSLSTILCLGYPILTSELH